MNPVALVTGASRGIGRGIALELAKLGHDLVINYARNTAAAKATASECADAARHAGKTIRAEPFKADISAAEDRVGLVEFTRTTFGRLDLLVNNAGMAPEVRADILEATEASFERLIETMRSTPGTRIEKLEAFYVTVPDRADAEPCLPCAEAVRYAAGR